MFNAGICTVNLNHFVINEFDFDAFEEQVELDTCTFVSISSSLLSVVSHRVCLKIDFSLKSWKSIIFFRFWTFSPQAKRTKKSCFWRFYLTVKWKKNSFRWLQVWKVLWASSAQILPMSKWPFCDYTIIKRKWRVAFGRGSFWNQNKIFALIEKKNKFYRNFRIFCFTLGVFSAVPWPTGKSAHWLVALPSKTASRYYEKELALSSDKERDRYQCYEIVILQIGDFSGKSDRI